MTPSSLSTRILHFFLLLAWGAVPLPAQAQESASSPLHWEPCGWGGGGFFYAAAFHPAKDGVIYLGGDVGGLYRSDDHGRSWRMINKGLADYGVFTLAVDRSNPDTVYAATSGGLCKSVDRGENWTLLPQTGPKELRLTGEKNKSIRSVAVDPADGSTVYAGSPGGKVFKSTDGGQTWKVSWEQKAGAALDNALYVQFGQMNSAQFGGFWIPLAAPAGTEGLEGIGLRVKAEGAVPQRAHLSAQIKDGPKYISKNLRDLFANKETQDIILRAEDFSVDQMFAKANPEKAAGAQAAPDLSRIARMDFSIVGESPNAVSTIWVEKVFFTAGGKNVTAREFTQDRMVHAYGNIRTGQPVGGPVYSVAVSAKDPSLVAAATNDAGIVLSRDKGATWTELSTPKKASNVTFDPADPNVLYAGFFTDGVWKSTDQGKTWTRLAGGLPPEFFVREIAVSPGNSRDVYAVGQIGWGGQFWISRDAGATWKSSTNIKADYAANPTLPQSGAETLSKATNIAINPLNPKQIYISANWRPCLSNDAGETLEESVKGADISCVTDIRFSGGRVYATAMDEGTLVSEDQGKTWRQLWPLKHDQELSGHNWRIAATPVNGVDRLIATGSPWDGKNSVVVIVSEDGGKTYKTTTEGIPTYRITANTMWGRGYPRTLAVDPSNPQTVYMGIDGDPTEGKSGGGVFKSEDGGLTWKQLPNQPASRRMYFGLAIDPTEPKRIYWAAFAKDGGVHMSEDGGETWKHVFQGDHHLFNIMTTADGTAYAGGKQLYRSTDKGRTWKTLTKLDGSRSVVGIEVHPKDPRTIWISATVWGGNAKGAVFKTTDGGETWAEITGDIPFVQPQILRFNPETNELWAGWVGLYKARQ